MTAKQIIRELTPPVLWRGRKTSQSATPAMVDEIVFRGDYSSWVEAEEASTRYSAPEILAKTRAAMLKVSSGEAVFERDSVVFDKAEYSFPLLAGLLRATANLGRLNVLDFGGALGSTYFQNRRFLAGLKELRWSVVEQPAHVACGQLEFANEQLRFYQTIDECLLFEQPNVLLLSSVVQYLSAPYAFLRQFLRYRIPHVIIDRTAFLEGGVERLTVQTVPEWIYPASYPAWFFSESRFVTACADEGYRLVADFPSTDHVFLDNGKPYFKGFLFDLEPDS